MLPVPDEKATPDLEALKAKSNLTNSQLLIWLGQQLNPTSPLYNMAMRFDICGNIDPDRFRRAFSSLVADSDAMRSVIVDEDRIPQQKVLETLAFSIDHLDYSEMEDSLATSQEEIDRRIQTPIDCSAINFDTVLIRLGQTDYIWYFNQHHLFTDITSIALIFQEISDRYRGHPIASGKLGSFERYRQSRSSPSLDNHLGNNTAEKLPSNTALLYGLLHENAALARGTNAIRTHYPLTQQEARQLDILAESEGLASISHSLALFNIVATALFAYLYRVSQTERLTLGCPIHNRTTLNDKNTIGLFIDILPLTVSVASQDTFLTLHEKVSQAGMAFLKNAAGNGGTIEDARTSNIILNYITASFTDFGDFPCQTTWLHNGHIDPQHDLRVQVLQLSAKDTPVIYFDINASILESLPHRSPISHFTRVLGACLKSPESLIAEVRLTSAEEGQRLQAQFQNSPLYSSQSSARETLAQASDTIVGAFKNQVGKTPDGIAAVENQQTITYTQLDRQSDYLAQQIIRETAKRSQTPEIIGICLPRSIALLIGLLAISKSGAAFVPLDPAHPKARLQKIGDLAGMQLLLCNRAYASYIDGIDCLLVDAMQDNDVSSGQNIFEAIQNPIRPSADRDAYVLFTSGSSGAPKGVRVKHGALETYIRWAAQTYCGIEPDSRQRLSDPYLPAHFPLYSSIGFDLTITSIFAPLIIGGCVHIYPEGKDAMHADALDLSILKVIQDDCVDVIKLTPSHLSIAGRMGLRNRRAHSLILGGENLTSAQARQAFRIFRPDIRIFNEYGPTEAVVGCMTHEFKPDTDQGPSVPIGRPADGVDIYLLDDGGNPVPNGVTGEIHIGGERLAAGYLHQPRLTQERFIPDPFRPPTPFSPGGMMYRSGDLATVNSNNDMVYLGRKDDQVKVRGVRVETAEISAALNGHVDIQDSYIAVVEAALKPQDDLHHCTECGLASNYPDVRFDPSGVCNFCREFAQYKDRADSYFGNLDALRSKLVDLSRHKTGKYHCLVLLSGGKDSTYALYQICRMGFSVFAMTLDNGYISEGAKDNIRRSVSDLGIDHKFVTTASMKEIFSDSLKRHASVCYGCFKTIYTLAINEAHQRHISTIVTGLSRGQLFETRLTKQVFDRSDFDPAIVDQEVLAARKIYHRIPDKVTDCLDTRLLDDDAIFEQIQFVDFYRYCDVPMATMYAFLHEHAPWTRPTDTGRSTNCLINDTGIYFHKRQKGYHNYALPYSWDVRLGHKERDAALQELNDQIDAGQVQSILTEIGYDGAFPDDDHTQLAAYYTSNASPSIGALKAHLRERLPAAMIPSYFVKVAEIPVNRNGKIDREALPNPRTQRPTSAPAIPPRTQQEKILTEVWRQSLGIDQIGVHDNFFELGGDSIIAIQIVARAAHQGMSITPHQLFSHQTIHQLAKKVVVSTSDAMTHSEETPFALIDHSDTSIESLASLLD